VAGFLSLAELSDEELARMEVAYREAFPETVPS
jgi:hypothetical protein